jgi:tetratricopeptide (TPR) repeat protein
MKQIIPLLLLLPMAFGAAAQSYSDSFYDALNSDNLMMQRQILAEWQQASPDDIDLYIARFNYHMGQTLGTSSTAAADSTVLVIDQAIQLFPDRLDLRFGKIYFLGEIRRWASFADEIISTLDRSELINHRWQFPNFDQGGRILIVEGVQDYLYTLFSSGQPAEDGTGQTAATTAPAPETLPQIRRIAHRAAQLFPSEPAFFSALAYTYIAEADYQTALHHLKRAEQLAPNDPAVLQQLVDVYTRMKDKKSAAQYRERLQKQ